MSGYRRNPREPQEKKPLSHGWIVVPSKTYPDRVYFFNTVTRCSTWNNPCEVSNDRASENIRSKSLSPQKIRCRTKSNSPVALQERHKRKHTSSFPDKNSNIHIDSEIEDYDEQHDQFFKNVPINAFSLSHSDFLGPSSPDSVSSLKTDASDSEDSKYNSLLEDNEKELWLHFLSSPPKTAVKKSIALSDFNEASTSVTNPEMESIKSKKKTQFPQSFMQDNHLNHFKTNETGNSDISCKKKKSRKKKRRESEGEPSKKGIEEKIIKNVSFKKKDKTPAQTRLLKLRKQNAEKLKQLAIKHPDLFSPKASDSDRARNSGILDSKGQSGQDNVGNAYFKGADICNDFDQGGGNFSRDEFNEEMDWEPSSEENDVRNINVFRQKLDKTNDSSSDIFFGLQSDHSLPLPFKTHSWFVVLDTNIFVSCLGFVKDLRDFEVPDLGYPVIYVPWRVLQELDHLKDTKIYAVDKHLHSNVRKAIAYLNENFKSGHPRVFGQSFDEFAKMIDVGVNAPDDEILQTCIKFQRQHPGKKLVLLTNDKNLESKAIVSGVEVYSKERFLKKYLNSGSISSSAGSSKATPGNGPPSNSKTEVDKALCEIKAILKDFVPVVVETEMKIAFEGDWVKLAFKKPPWNLQDALECLLKHWRAVFFLVFSKETQSEAQKLYERLFRKEAGSVEEVVDIIKTIERLILSIKRSQKKKRPYLELAEVAMTKLSSMLSSLSPNYVPEADSGVSSCLLPSAPVQEGSFCPPQSASQSGTHHNDVARVKNLFKDIWDSLRSFCCSISDMVHSAGTCDTADLQNIRIKMSQVITEVTELVHITEKIFEVNLADVKESHPLINHFSNFLIRVYPAMEPELQRELPKCLAAFFTDFEGRSLLNNSLKDFKEFSHDLISAIEYFNAHLTG